MRALVVPVKERMRGLQQSVEGGQELAMGDLTAERPPPQLNRGQPRAVGRQVEQPQPPSCGADDGLDVIIEMGVGIIPGDVDGAGRMAVDQSLQQLGHFPAPCAAAEQHDGFARRVIAGAQTIALVRLAWGGS